MSIEAPMREFFAQTRERTRDQISEELEFFSGLYKKTPWHYYETPLKEYEDVFRDILGMSFGLFLRERKRKKGKVFVMDVMGQGGYLSKYRSVTKEVIITLAYPPYEQKEQNTKKGRLVIAGEKEDDMSGHVLRNSPWRTAQSIVDTYDDTALPGYDLITCLPRKGGWRMIRGLEDEIQSPMDNKYTKIVDWIILQRSYSLLSNNGGTLLVGMPEDVNYSNWVGKLQQIKGLSVDLEQERLRITKLDGSLVALPKM